LGLGNVGGVFVVLIAGTLAAFLMAILELLWNCRKIAVEEKVTYNRCIGRKSVQVTFCLSLPYRHVPTALPCVLRAAVV
jgi:hypothetical protein